MSWGMSSRSLEILTDACGELPVVIKRMFGGYGFFAPNGGMFAGIVTDDAVIMKLAHGPARDELIAEGGHPWVYDGQAKPMTMAEWIVVPERFYDDGEAFAAWARRAFELAPPKTARKQKSRAPASQKGNPATTPRTKPVTEARPPQRSKPAKKAKPVTKARPAQKASSTKKAPSARRVKGSAAQARRRSLKAR